VKGCGKSAPRGRQRQRQGKPHREQNQIGVAGRARQTRDARSVFRLATRVGCLRRPAMGVPDEWPSRRGNPSDRTRLTGRLVFSTESLVAHALARDDDRTYASGERGKCACAFYLAAQMPEGTKTGSGAGPALFFVRCGCGLHRPTLAHSLVRRHSPDCIPARGVTNIFASWRSHASHGRQH
jgi:hypothetical protein